MWILPLLGFLGLGLGFCFLTLAIASGLYYLSELVEEHTVISSKLLSRLIYCIVVILLLLWLFDSLPLSLTTLSIASHVIYLQNLRKFPIVKLTDPIFLASCVLVMLNHYLWFRHFSQPRGMLKTSKSSSRYPVQYASPVDYNSQPSFTEIASFFGICVWLVPFALFISLSAAENVLPSMTSERGTNASALGVPGRESASTNRRPGSRARGAGMAKALVDGARNWFGETGEILGLWKGENMRHLRGV